MGAAHPGFELNPDQRAPKMKSLMTRYRIDFDPDKIGLRVLLDAAALSLYARAKKIPLVGSRHLPFYISKGSHPELESEPTGFSTDRYGAENIALLSVPLAQSIQERLKNRQPITAQAESAECTTLNSIARLLTQLKSTTKEA
jgi:hypothetical protein